MPHYFSVLFLFRNILNTKDLQEVNVDAGFFPDSMCEALQLPCCKPQSLQSPFYHL
jgi:hypothetical protein